MGAWRLRRALADRQRADPRDVACAVSHMQRGEFKALTSVISRCDQVGEVEYYGFVCLHLSSPPCLSSIGAAIQFKLLFPQIALHIDFQEGEEGFCNTSTED